MKKQPEKKPAKSGHELLEKMGQLIEEQPEASAPPAQEPPGEKPTSPNRNRALMTYIAFLFGVAFVLVLLSFLIQQKDSRQTISELNQNANSALSRAEQLQDNNRELLEANQAAAADYRGGNQKVLGFLVGQTMKAMKGKANPGMINQILKELL